MISTDMRALNNAGSGSIGLTGHVILGLYGVEIYQASVTLTSHRAHPLQVRPEH